MGAAPSTSRPRAADAGDMDDAWADRAWADGVPFTLLHDDAFVAEKYQELKGAGDAAEDDALETTGTDELPMDELERMADAARVKLFARRDKRRRAGERDGDNAATEADDGRPRKMLSALDAMEGTTLDRQPRAWVAAERRRAKQCEIVRDYMARMAVRMEKRARAAIERERVGKLNQATHPSLGVGAVEVEKATLVASRRAGAASCAALPGSRLFHVASFRMQLEMLKAFRTTSSILFETGILSLVNTILEFPPFALHQGGEDGETKAAEASTNSVLIDDVHRFCSEIFLAQDLVARHRDVLLVLLLALGVCSGRSALLVEFVAGVVARTVDDVQDGSQTSSVGGRGFGEWIEDLLVRLELYRVEYDLGTLKDDSFVKHVNIKVIKDDAATTTDAEGSELKQPTSIATDGSYVYTWSLVDGLSKIGTGLNFTVAGRVYAQAPAQQFLDGLREQRTFQCGFYGSGLDATSLIQDFASSPTRAYFEENILVALSAEDQESHATEVRRLFVLIEKDSATVHLVFDNHEELCSRFTEDGFLEGAEVLFAFYGDFVLLHDEALGMLKDVSAVEDSTDSSIGALLDSALLKKLLALSAVGDALVSSEKELILLYSTSSNPRHLFLEKFAEGEIVSVFDHHGDNVYFSSMVMCGSHIYLSLLYPLASSRSRGSGDDRHEPRKLLRISPIDLSIAGIMTLSARDGDIASGLSREVRVCRPLFAYVTEGLRLYEVEMSAERFRVRVFGGLAGSKPVDTPTFVRSFDVNVKQIQCATFVNCFLKILKRELRVGDFDFVLPTFFTNGSNMCMLLPSLSPARALQASDSGSRFDCFMFDCEKGQFVSDEPRPRGCEAMAVDEKRHLKSFERTLPSSSCCFDATSNIVWVANMARGTLSLYKNSGRRIALPDTEDDDLPPAVLSRPATGNASADHTVLRVLSFLTKHANDFADSTSGTETSVAEQITPFSSVGDIASMQRLLDLAERYSSIRTNGTASGVHLECLRCCLSLLRRVVAISLGFGVSEQFARFQSRIPNLLANVIHQDTQAQPVTGSNGDGEQDFGRQQIDLRVVSAALALSAQTTHLVDADLNSQLDRVVDLIKKWRKRSLSPSDHVVAVSLLRQLRKTIENTAEANAPSLSTVFERFETIWKELVEAQESVVRDDYGSDGDANMSVHQELLVLVNFFLQHTFIRSLMDAESLELTLKIFQLVCNGIQTVCAVLTRLVTDKKLTPPKMEKKLRGGLVRQLTPIVLANATLLLRNNILKSTASEDPDRATQSSESGSTPGILDNKTLRSDLGKWLKSESATLCDLFISLNELADVMNAEAQTVSVSTISRTTRTEVMESNHEYENDLNVTRELRIPGATQITITFDSRSRTEFSYDYVTFYKDKAQTSYYGEQYYTGRDAEFNWPGVNGLPPLVINSDHCYVYFHTDGSNTDWGYKFTAVGEMFEKASITQRHWLTSLAEMAVGVIDEAARLLVEGTQLVPISDTEAQNDKILHSELLRHGIAADREQDVGVLQLLREFAFPTDDSDAARVLGAIERVSGNFRLRSMSKSAFGAETGVLSKNPINAAIRAATAAILHHNMWGMDAYALAQNLRTDVSEQLLRGLKNAQKMRDWFHLGDAAGVARSGMESPSSRSSRNLLRRQPSAYKGMSDAALDVLSKNVVERANFLLEVTPMSFSYVSGAKRRWGFLAKYGSALGVAKNQLSRSTSNSTLGKWYTLLDELQEATELRSLLHYRRSSSERRKSRRLKSVTEQVLEFIQSDIDVQDLRDLIAKRNERAAYRACGLWLYRTVSAGSHSIQMRMALAESCSKALRNVALGAAMAVANLVTDSVTAMPSRRLHFGTFLSGCDGAMRKDVNNAFGACLHHYVEEIAKQEVFDTEYVIALIKAVCIDYDGDDTYLLHESGMLGQLIRLLASKASRVRRSAQILLDIFLSRLSDNSGDNEDNTASLFQSQLFATVGLQLEGITSHLRDLGASRFSVSNALRDREHNLGSLPSGYTAPITTDCDVRWNHSIMVWMFVSSAMVSYSLKIGDEVRRGPSWGEKEGEQSMAEVAETSGTVTAITSPTSVRVKWRGKVEEQDYEFDPKQGKLDVVLANESIGGVVFCKGTKTLLYKEDTVASPWSHFGLFLNDRRQLSYRISCGPEKECVYDTNFELDCNEWAHVAIIQNEEVLKFYINGLMVTQHILDPFLVLQKPFSASESRMIESTHPIAESVDQYWPVHIPGASKIRVTFDPLSEIDHALGFVRFYKNARCNEVWGEDKYSGRYHDPERNFPGALSNRHRSRRSLVAAIASQGALEIPCDRFLVYLHHSGDATSWGFRLLATPEFASAHQSGTQQPSLNAHPFFIGEPPARILDNQAAKCWIYQPQLVNAPLEDDAIIEEMQASCPANAPKEIPVERALHVIGLLQTCAETSYGSEVISTPENVGDLIMLAFEEMVPVEVRCASIEVLKQLCTTLSAEFVADQFKRVQPVGVEYCDYVGFVFGALSNAVSVWSRCNQENDYFSGEEHGEIESTETPPPSPIDLQVSSTEGLALVSAYVSLFRRLAQHPDWVESVCGTVEAALEDWKILQSEAELNSARHEHRNGRWKGAAANITAALVLLGGGYDGVSFGGRVRCCANIDSKETTETGYLLRFQQTTVEDSSGVPLSRSPKQRLRTARILFDCDPANPVNVPISDVAYLNDEDEDELEVFLQTVAPRLFAGAGQRLYASLLSELEADLPREHVFFKPKVTRKENVEVLESEHPYASGEDITYPLFVNGVQEIIIFFDEMSSTASQNDYVSFLKRSDDDRLASHLESNNGKPYWGEERYYGDNFPGVRGAPPLRIPASSVDVHFHTESSSMGSGVPSSEWGFKLTAHAYEETVNYPPEMPPSLTINAVNDIRARALKSLYTCLRLMKPTPIYRSMSPSMGSLVSCVAKLANASDDGRPTQLPSRSQTFESSHPYSNSVRECMTVTFSGAARLKITFDPRTKTEQGNDYVTFFKDQSMSDRWGEQQYSGSDDSSNWPGFGDRLPLVIASDSFTLLWVTDASTVDWGWRFTVAVEYPVIAPMSLRLDQLNKQAHAMWEIFYEGIGPQRRPFLEEYDGYEQFTTTEEWQMSQLEHDTSRFLLLGSTLDDQTRVKQNKLRKFRVIEDAGVDVLDSQTVSGNVVGKFEAGDEFLIISESKEWLKTRVKPGTDTVDSGNDGWIKRRTDDKVHVIAVDTLLQNEDVLVIGVDDTPECLVKPNDNLHLDDNNGERDLLMMFVSQFNIEALKGQSTRYQSLAYDTHRALAVKYARETLHLLVSTAAESSPDSEQQVELHDFGSPSEFLLILMHIFDDRGGRTDEQALENGLQHLLINSADEDARALVDRCLGVLTASVYALPSARGAMRVLESRHPYPDDAELYWQMSIPGAKRILVYFDPQSKTEESCDWVCFYKNGTDRAEFYGESMYHGRNGTENWPGCGGRLPLVIDADNFEVYFHSDANQNDWGFKFFAIGVFDENDGSPMDVQPLVGDKLHALVRLMRLSLWLLGVAVRACLAAPDRLRSSLASAVFSPRLVEVLRAGIQDHPQQVRALGLKLLQQLAQNVPFVHSLPSGMVEALHNQLVAKIRAQFLAEDRTESKSEYLQMLVECAIFVDLATDSACYTPRKSVDTEDMMHEGKPIAFSTPSDQSSGNAVEWTMAPVSARDGVLHFQFIMRSISGPFHLKLVSRQACAGTVDPGICSEALFHWESSGELIVSPLCGASSCSLPTARLLAGDTISIYLNLEHHVLVLRRNDLCVCNCVEVDLKNTLRGEDALLSFAVRASSVNDSIMMKQLEFSPLASLPTAVAPNWYNRACDSVSLLLDFEEQRESNIVECESEHPLQEPEGENSRAARERVCLPGAHALEIRFDRRTVLDDRHRLRFFASQDDRDFVSQIVGIRGTKCDEKYPALFLNDSVKRTGILKPNDRVVRSSDWCYADEDGGPGTIGHVEAIIPWNGRSGCGVRVRWESSTNDIESFTGVYRYGYDGFFDVQLVRQPNACDTPLVIPGDTLEYLLEPVEEIKRMDNSLHDNGATLFKGTLRIDPLSGSALCLDVRKTKLVLGDDCTIEFWIFVQDKSIVTPEDPATILSLVEILTLDPTHGLLIGATSDGKLCVVTRADQDAQGMQSSTQESVNTRVFGSQWVHVGIVFSASKVLLYANGDRVSEAHLDQKLSARTVYVSALQFGGQFESRFTSVGRTPVLPVGGHICDVRIWNVSLRSEQVHSHASGIDGVSPRDSVGWQSPTAPPAPRKQSRSSPLHQLMPPPSPPRSPRSPSRSISSPLTQRRWVTANRTGRDLVTVRADCPILASFSNEDRPTMIYFEAHVLSNGKVCVGFADVGMKPSSRQALLGEYKHAVGLELPRKRAHFGGEAALELEDPSVDIDALRSPRRRSSSSSGAFFGDVFSREGDVIGCGYVPSTKDFRFFVNGDLVVQVQVDDASRADLVGSIPSPRQVQREFDALVDEMLSMGFSREASEDALEATSGTAARAVPRAVDWLIEEGTSLSSPRRLSSSSPFASPRRRLSSAASGTPTRRAISTSVTSEQGHFVPAATLGAQGAQGIAWNFGHRAFKYAPTFDGVVVSAMSASNRQDTDSDAGIYFEVFNHADAKWERVAHRHRVQEMTPTLLARWKLDEGSGMTVYDSSGREQIGTIQSARSTPSGALSPRSRKSASCWDSNCMPPVAASRSAESPLFTPFPGTEVPDVAFGTSRQATVWGYRFYVIPHYSTNSIGRKRFQTQAHRFIMDGPPAEHRHDHQLIKYVNKVAVTKQLSLSQLLRASWPEIAPNESELVKWPALVELATGVSTSTSTDDTEAVTRSLVGSAKAAALDRLGKRFKLLQELNSAVSRLLPFVAFSKSPATGADTRLDKLICDERYRILHTVKRGLWDEALKRTTEKGDKVDLVVNRPKAMRHRVSGKVDTEGRFALFSQAFRQLNIMGGHQFRRSQPIYKVEFLGENAQDAGGPYRETLAQYADELHSAQLPLLIASSNAQHNVGAAREKWVLNPSATSATQLAMLEFLGKLLGAAMRSQEYMPLSIALLIWKRLAGERASVDDLALVDSMIVSSMDKIRSIDKYGVTAEMFEDIVLETFTTLSTDNRVVPLKPHGASLAVTFDSRVEFADLVEAYRLSEFDVQIAALLRGLAKVVPPRLLSLFTGAELEQLVCGSPEVDVDLLEQCTEYSSCSAEDAHIVWFWQVLRAFSHDERSAFLRFVWGRSRLPPSEKEFPQRFKLLSFSKPIQGGTADAYLPIAHTCFFSVELPRYSSAEVLKEKLTYAMYNCQEIDGDGDSVAANQLGWEE